MLAKTEASGGEHLHPEVLAFSSSLSLDKQLLREDLLGSLAHLTMLSRQGIIPKAQAEILRRGLTDIWKAADDGTLELPEEEDVHMAVEAELANRIGEPSGLLHTSRSRNDQVALDLRLHVRAQLGRAIAGIADLLEGLATRADAERDTVIPAYTHRQRAQPVSVAYWLCGHAASFVRDGQTFAHALSDADALPLGVGAISGTSLPIDRNVTRELLKFSRLTMNGMDTVGDRDFALDYLYGTARFVTHASRLSTDVIDYASSEFKFIHLSGEIACGSSMMPQKRNPDVFELVRGKSGRAVGNLMGLFTTVKGLPGGYNRDLQEDRQTLLETGPLLGSVLWALNFAIPRIRFDAERCLAAIDGDYTQATDLAEILVKQGVPFRQAYKAVGAVVRACQEANLPLAKLTLELAKKVDPRFDEAAVSAMSARAAVARKESAGGTGPKAVEAQISELRAQAKKLRAVADGVPSLPALFESVRSASL